MIGIELSYSAAEIDARLALAETATQPADLGTAAAAAATDFATAAQGGLADTAVQPSDLTGYATTSADLADFTSGTSTSGQVPTADGAGGVAWVAPATGADANALALARLYSITQFGGF